MKKLFSPIAPIIGLLALVALVSCQSRQASQTHSNTQSPKGPIDPTLLPESFKFSFFISGSGGDGKPFDSWTMDTSNSMTVHVTRKNAKGKFENLTAMAQLDPQDLDTLRMLIRNGKLNRIDSNDLTQQCAGDELYIVKIVPLRTPSFANLSFDACAADYNLLLEPQRRYFRKLMDWWERMRVKYRPNQPE